MLFDLFINFPLKLHGIRELLVVIGMFLSSFSKRLWDKLDTKLMFILLITFKSMDKLKWSMVHSVTPGAMVRGKLSSYEDHLSLVKFPYHCIFNLLLMSSLEFVHPFLSTCIVSISCEFGCQEKNEAMKTIHENAGLIPTSEVARFFLWVHSSRKPVQRNLIEEVTEVQKQPTITKIVDS